MKIIKFLLVIFILLTSSFKANSNTEIINSLKEGGKLIFIRHAYAPGSGDPVNFILNDCSTQRNLNERGRKQSIKIGAFFNNNFIKPDKILTSQWCRCKETAFLAFKEFEEQSFLNSFYDEKFSKNKEKQIKELKKFVKKWNSKKNLVFVTHYVVISEVLSIYPSSGEIIISDKNYNVIGNLKFEY